VLVSCDSNPAPYAGKSNEPCYAYITLAMADPDTLAEQLTKAGYRVAGPGIHRCPTCTRAIVAKLIDGGA
jgi:hypothetical protein